MVCWALRSALARCSMQRRPMATVDQPPLLACHVYVSEGRDAAVIERLRQLARDVPTAVLANTFVDAPYHRSNFTLLSRSASGLAAAAAALARAALDALDLRAHDATHPRLGVVDHVSFHPLLPPGPASMALAAHAARGAAELLSSGPAALPVYCYGHAHPRHAALDDVRRALGYFGSAESGRWRGALHALAGKLPPPCYGPTAAQPHSGVCCVGAVPWLVNYNVLLATDDLVAATRVARAVSQRGGGLPSVQAMALQHAEGMEVACNLLDPGAVPPATVHDAVSRAAAAAGIAVVRGYQIGKTADELIALAAEKLPS